MDQDVRMKIAIIVWLFPLSLVCGTILPCQLCTGVHGVYTCTAATTCVRLIKNELEPAPVWEIRLFSCAVRIVGWNGRLPLIRDRDSKICHQKTRPTVRTTLRIQTTTRPSVKTTLRIQTTTRPSVRTTLTIQTTTRPSVRTTGRIQTTTQSSVRTTRRMQITTRPSVRTTRSIQTTTRSSVRTTRRIQTTWSSLRTTLAMRYKGNTVDHRSFRPDDDDGDSLFDESTESGQRVIILVCINIGICIFILVVVLISVKEYLKKVGSKLKKEEKGVIS